MKSATHFWSAANPHTTACNRVVLDHARVSHSWAEVTCNWCLRQRPGPKVRIEGLSYRMTVKASGRPARTFAGHTPEELARDVEAARAELAAPARSTP
jgi:hypothetical protein